MTDRRRGLGRGLGALIPSAPAEQQDRPRDVFFPRTPADDESAAAEGSRFTGNTPADVGVPDTSSGSSPVAHEDFTPAKGLEGGEDSVTRAEDTSEDTQPGPTALEPVPGASFAEISVDEIRPNPRQPREVFDEDELAELVASIGELGILQPVVVRPTGRDDVSAGQDRYELVMGERRLRAAKAAGLATIPAIIRETGDEHMLRDALLENLHRAQLNPLEEAAAYQQLLQDFGCTQDELAGRIGRSRPQISNTIRLLKLPPMVQRRVASGVLSAGHARALLGLSDGAAMERLAQRIVAEGLSVRSVEEIVMMGQDDQPRHRRSPRRQPPNPELQVVADRLSDRLETRVQVAMGRHKGKITVEFAGQEDLDRILAVLGGD